MNKSDVKDQTLASGEDDVKPPYEDETQVVEAIQRSLGKFLYKDRRGLFTSLTILSGFLLLASRFVHFVAATDVSNFFGLPLFLFNKDFEIFLLAMIVAFLLLGYLMIGMLGQKPMSVSKWGVFLETIVMAYILFLLGLALLGMTLFYLLQTLSADYSIILSFVVFGILVLLWTLLAYLVGVRQYAKYQTQRSRIVEKNVGKTPWVFPITITFIIVLVTLGIFLIVSAFWNQHKKTSYEIVYVESSEGQGAPQPKLVAGHYGDQLILLDCKIEKDGTVLKFTKGAYRLESQKDRDIRYCTFTSVEAKEKDR